MVRRSIAVLIPAHNEEKTIGEIVSQASKYCTVYVVDDCSSDLTRIIAKNAGGIVISSEVNLGYEGALNKGFEVISKNNANFVITMDADGEHDPNHIPEFIDLLVSENFNLVLGFRQKPQRFVEYIIGFIMKRKYLVNDIYCGMKGYDLALWQNYGSFDYYKSAGLELAVHALKQDVKFGQISVLGTPRYGTPRYGNGIILNLKLGFSFLKTIIR
ncbi:glycosyltransferase family 2 protein [Amylibacter sp.]|nr:glycosyltransferase family 2 protein [Amylibacter sp.]